MKKQIGMLAAVFALCASHAGATSLVFADFSDVSTLQLNGSAARVGNVLRLTPASTGQSGTAFSLSPVTLSGAYSFSTFFSFRISSVAGTFGDADGPGADGITFIVQTNSSTAGGGGGGIGYQAFSTARPSSTTHITTALQATTPMATTSASTSAETSNPLRRPW